MFIERQFQGIDKGGPQVQPLVAVETFLEEVKFELAIIEFDEPRDNISTGERHAVKTLYRVTKALFLGGGGGGIIVKCYQEPLMLYFPYISAVFLYYLFKVLRN